MEYFRLNQKDLQKIMVRENLAANEEDARGKIEAVLDSILISLSEASWINDHVKLHIMNFGTFIVKPSPGCRRRIPGTGEVIQTSAHPRLSFKPSTALRKQVKQA